MRQVDQGLVLSFKYKGKATSHLLARDRYTRLWTINNKDYGIAAGTLSEVRETVCVAEGDMPLILPRRLEQFVTALQSPVKGWPRPLGQVIPRDATTEAATAEAAAEAAGETATAVAEPLSSAAEPPAETHPAEPTAEFVLSDVGDAFYHGHISKDEVDGVLADRSGLAVGLIVFLTPSPSAYSGGHKARLLCDKNNTDGTFLVYARGTAADHYVLSVIYRSKPTHHLLEMRDGTLTVNGSETPATNLPEVGF